MSTSKLTPNGGEKIIVTNTEQKIPEHKTQKQTEGEFLKFLIFLSFKKLIFVRNRKIAWFLWEIEKLFEFKSFLWRHNNMTLGKQRIMPTHHVEYLLEIYSEYLKKRMLDSGRLSKGK